MKLQAPRETYVRLPLWRPLELPARLSRRHSHLQGRMKRRMGLKSPPLFTLLRAFMWSSEGREKGHLTEAAPAAAPPFRLLLLLLQETRERRRPEAHVGGGREQEEEEEEEMVEVVVRGRKGDATGEAEGGGSGERTPRPETRPVEPRPPLLQRRLQREAACL